jgi:hypothetical protein
MLAARPGLRPAWANRWLGNLALLQKDTPEHTSIQLRLNHLAEPPHVNADASLRQEAGSSL